MVQELALYLSKDPKGDDYKFPELKSLNFPLLAKDKVLKFSPDHVDLDKPLDITTS